MAKEGAKLQGACTQCQEALDIGGSLFIQEVEDWRKPYLDFFQLCLWPSKRSDVMKMKRKSSRFFLEESLLFRRDLNQEPLRCIARTK